MTPEYKADLETFISDSIEVVKKVYDRAASVNVTTHFSKDGDYRLTCEFKGLSCSEPVSEPLQQLTGIDRLWVSDASSQKL